MSNPAWNNSAAFSQTGKGVDFARANAAMHVATSEQLQQMYEMPAASPAQTDRMSYDDVLMKIAGSFAVLVGFAFVGWQLPVLTIPAAIVGFVLAMVNIFRKQPPIPALILAYAAVEGIFVGGISNIYNYLVEGSVLQAVVATFIIIGVTLALYSTGKFRPTPKWTKIVVIAMIGYLLFSVVNFILMMTGVTSGMFGLRSTEIMGIPLGAILGVVVILLASYSLVMDFDSVRIGVERGAPRIYGWSAAFGIMVTVIWLYLEMLRLIAILNQR